jgi:RNA polymerase sigma factor (sigma-70 family)
MPATATILERIASGDRPAVTECIDAYSGLVWSLARRFLANEADAEEAVQEIFLELWEIAGRYDPAVAAEATFVSMLARRRLIDRRRRIDREPGAEPLDESSLPPCDRAHRQLEASADVHSVLEVMGTLKTEQQEVLGMASWLGMSHGAIADQTGLPLGTVKSHISRGLSTIRNALGEPARVRKASS